MNGFDYSGSHERSQTSTVIGSVKTTELTSEMIASAIAAAHAHRAQVLAGYGRDVSRWMRTTARSVSRLWRRDQPTITRTSAASGELVNTHQL
jgi:hypothetical protein